LSNAVKENPVFVDNWQVLNDANVDESVRRNVDAVSDPDATVDAKHQERPNQHGRKFRRYGGEEMTLIEKAEINIFTMR